MVRSRCGSHVRLFLVLAASLVLCTPTPAVDRQKNGRDATNPLAEEVELFAAVQQQQINVQLIPHDELQCRLLISNKTDKPLSVKLPASFAGVPVLAQIGQLPIPGMGPGNNRNADPFNNNPAKNAPQRVGGGSGSMMLNVPPESMRRVKLETVCLDHGNPVPRATIKYEIRPVAAAMDKAGVAEVCEMLGRHEISHRAAQLAAWHLSNDMSWRAGRIANQASHRLDAVVHEGGAEGRQESRRQGPGTSPTTRTA